MGVSMNEKTLYVFGNEYLKEDSFARVVAQHLKHVRVVHATTPDVLLDAGKELVILDVVKDIQEPMLIKDIQQLKTRNIMSLHDFDVGFFLTLMEQMGIRKKLQSLAFHKRGMLNK